MSRFKFSLDAVLTLRAREEQAAMGKWAQAMQAQAQAEETLADAERRLEECHRFLQEKRRDTFRPGDQELYLSATTHQKELCERLLDQVKRAVEFTAAQHALFLEARMKHEVLKRLREKRMKEYETELSAREETAIADLVIGRYAVRRAH